MHSKLICQSIFGTVGDRKEGRDLGLARTSGVLPQRCNNRSGRLFLGCAHGRRKKRAFCSRSGAISVCTTQARGTCSVTSQHVLRPNSSRNLDVARRTYNYRLTRARRILLCAFGIVCNKWRIFHGATDVCPDFCDVTVKTCCILDNFVRQRDGFQFQGTLYECPLESIKAVFNRSNVTGTDMGRRAQRIGMSLCWGGPGRGLVYR